MVLLAAAICTKNGKALLSRQFVEMTRSRIEGLLSAFPKLMNSGKQHTFVETDSVRYVYQPLDKLFMLLITTKASNILEDLETLRLFSRVVPEYCKVLEEAEILENSFQLLFAFDEIVALGYRESVNLAQIRTFIEMDSHEERVINAVRRTQEIEAKEQMKRKAKELQRASTGRGKTSALLSGFGSMSSSAARHEVSNPVVGDSAMSDPAPSKPSYQTRPTGSGKALKLGGKGKDVDSFVNKLRQEGTEITSPNSNRSTSKAPTPTVPMSSVHIKVDEKITLSAGRHGDLHNMEIRGMALLRISDPALARISLNLENFDSRGFQMQTHPNIDKKLFSQNSVIALKQGGKGFPMNSEIGILKWRLQTKDENMIPLTINCWPNENDGQCEVTIEYELKQEELELNDVLIQIPIPSGVGGPVVGELTGDYHYDHRKAILDWQLPVIDASNTQGSLEFTIAGHPDDFYPINVSFYSPKTMCNIQINEVQNSETRAPAKFSQEKVLTVDKYEIV